MTTSPSEALAGLLILSAVNCAITMIITESGLFEGVRDWADDRNEKLGELVSCSLCAGTWIGFIIAAVTAWRLDVTGTDILFAFIVIAFAPVTGGLILKRLTGW